MSERDASGDGFTGGVSGSQEEAAWRDLIARYEMPAGRNGGPVPWPDREDLADDQEDPRSSTDTDAEDTDGTGTSRADASGTGTDTGQPGTSDRAGTDHAGVDHAGVDHAGVDHAGVDHAGTDPAGTDRGEPDPAGTDRGGTDPAGTARAARADRGRDQTAESAGTDDAASAEKPPAQGPGFRRTRVIRPASPSAAASAPPGRAGRRGDAGTSEPGANATHGRTAGRRYASDGGNAVNGLDATDGTDDDEHYIPPPPPPLPHLDPVAKGAWTALFGGPAYLFVSTLIGQSPPGWAALLAVAAFIGGFAVVVLRLGGGPSRGDGPDNGAVL